MKQHPSGRPIRTENRRSWHYGPHVEHGFRNWRFNPPPVPRITGATDLHAVGFIDWEARAAADELESSAKVGADSHGV